MRRTASAMLGAAVWAAVCATGAVATTAADPAACGGDGQCAASAVGEAEEEEEVAARAALGVEPGVGTGTAAAAGTGAASALELLQLRGAKLVDQHRATSSSKGGRRVAGASSVRPARRLYWPDLFGAFRAIAWDCAPWSGKAEDCYEHLSDGAGKAFGALVKASSSAIPLTADELNAFGQRFSGAVVEEARAIFAQSFGWGKFNAWNTLLTKVFEDQRPAVPKALVDHINQQAFGWRAVYRHEMVHTSLAHFKDKLGLDATTEEERANATKEADEKRADDLALLGSNLSAYDGPYAVWDHWPQCAGVMRHVRFQTCPNCWSHSTALITESRVCVKTGGKFGGRDAWLSQSYVAACRADSQYYCNSASGTLGFKTVSQFGVPTGASDRNGNADPEARTCYPQIPAKMQSVRCPASCAEEVGYQRDLRHDTFYLRYVGYRSLLPSDQLTQMLAKRSLVEEGPIMVGFHAFQDLLAYESGIYRPVHSPDNRPMGGHAVTAMGFGPGYYLCTNSWGDKWGDRGTFHIATEAIDIGYYVPGRMEYGKYGRFPIPVP